MEEYNTLGELVIVITELIIKEQRACYVGRIGIPDIFVTIGSYKDLLSKYNMNGTGIAEQIRKWM